MSATKASPATLVGPNEAASPLAAALFPSPPLEERGRERRSSFSASTPDLLVRQPAGTSPHTAASRMVRDLLSPTLSSKGGDWSLDILLSETEANPSGWQMVAGGRSGQGVDRLPESMYWVRAPQRGARSNPDALRLWHPCQGAGHLLRRYPEVAAPREAPGDLRLPSGNPLGWPLKNVQTPITSKGGEGEPITSCSGPPDARDAQARPPLAAAASPAPAHFARHILLVEDESAILQFSTAVLVHGGYQVTAVEGCEAAWEAIQSASYDLLVTDNKMPGMSGLELVSKLRSAQIWLPIVVASGGVEAEEFTQNQSLQPAIALPKPFTAKQLLETVAEALRRAGGQPGHTEPSSYTSCDAYNHWGINE